jgi:Asp-tRNA(Asn)/Glu-tRNA(Gln) amidotransferase A subunit family amidase
MMATRIEELTATEALALIRRRKLSALELTKACLARIVEREAIVGAWAHVDADRALAQAKALDAAKPSGPLHGLPIGVKDVIDTVDLPTSYGSSIYSEFRPARNAVCVERLTKNGAIILGKTVTTELANRHPGKTANPRNPLHTPGGSSSGSAAAVADFMVPMALGTQTTGSLIRPASYCGAFGYKPTYGLVDTTGVLPLSPSLDTLGVIARAADDLDLFRSLFVGKPCAIDRFTKIPPRLAICHSPAWSCAEPGTEAAMESVAEMLSRQNCLHHSKADDDEHLGGLIDAQRTIMAVETARSLAADYRDHVDQLSGSLRALIEKGARVSATAYAAALQHARAARARLHDFFGDAHAVLTPSTAGEAPSGLQNTGEPVFNAIWTLLHVPCVTVPVAAGPNGLPIGIQVVGRIGDDETVLAVAKWLSTRVAAESGLGVPA